MSTKKKSPQKTASKSKGFHPVVNDTKLREHQERLLALSSAVNEVMRNHGFLADGDQMICEDVIVILPNGQSRVERRCYPVQSTA